MVVKVAEKRRKKPQRSRKTLQKERLWTFDEMLAELPETNQPTELWDGELIMTPSPTPYHQDALARLEHAFRRFVEPRQLGRIYFAPLDVILTKRRVVQPDIVYIARANEAIIKDRIRGVPDLLVEIISPGSWRRDRIEKKALYEQHGVKEYWIVDLEAQTIEIWALKSGSYELAGRFGPGDKARSRLLDGFQVAVNEILD